MGDVECSGSTKSNESLKAIEFYDDEYLSRAQKAELLYASMLELELKKPVIDTPDDLRNLVVMCRTHHRLK